MDKKNTQQVGIIGDGLTGKLTAIALFRLGYGVELVGKKNLKIQQSIASISISHDSYNFLKQLNIHDLDKIANSIYSIKLYENSKDHLDPDSIFYNKTKVASPRNIKKPPLSVIAVINTLDPTAGSLPTRFNIKGIITPMIADKIKFNIIAAVITYPN